MRKRFKKRRRGGFSKKKKKFPQSSIVKPPPSLQTPDNFSEVKNDENLFSDVTIDNMSNILDKRLIRQLKDYLQYSKFTSIQHQCIGPVLEGKDVFIKSATGTGKTVGFLVPILQLLINISKTERISRKDGMRVLIVSPTRELSTQTFQVLEQLARPLPFLVPGLVIGGTSMKSEKSRLRKGIGIVIGTPGRILYHLKNTASFTPTKLSTIILDEADKLLDMGFESQIKEIYSFVNPNVNKESNSQRIQSLLVSATLSEKVETLSSWCLSKENVKFVGNEMKTMSIPSTLKQFYVKVTPKMRFVTLVSFLISKTHSEWVGSKPSKILIFFSNCSCVDFFHVVLKKLGIFGDTSFLYSSKNNVPIFKLHGKMEQGERSNVYNEFSKATHGILLTTDVLCRGIDLPCTDWVIQFDAPGQPFDYLHRIGRTSRIGKEGNSLLFLMDHEIPYLKMLQGFHFSMEEIHMVKLLEYLVSLYPNERHKNGYKYGKLMQRRIEGVVEGGDSSVTELCKTAIIDFLRAYSTHGKDLKFIFHTKFLNIGKVCGSFGMNKTPSEVFRSRNKFGGKGQGKFNQVIDYSNVTRSRGFSSNSGGNQRMDWKKKNNVGQKKVSWDKKEKKRWGGKRGRRNDDIGFGKKRHEPPKKRRKF